jgi:fructosamine-3-kinase
MLDKHLVSHLEQRLSEQGEQPRVVQIQAAGGGCINDAYHLTLDSGLKAFVKINQASLLDMFEAEAEGLKALSQANSFVIPKPLATGTWQQHSYLLLEHLSFTGRYSEHDLGSRLARLHNHSQDQFGFERDNYIGASPQSNTWHNNWFEFFMQERLEVQLKMLSDQGRASRLKSLWPQLCQACEALFAKHSPQASLVHGDLWQGNVSQTSAGCSIYDPACYYGDAETDLAMLTLFGHLSSHFYDSYQAIRTIPEGHDLRVTWYNLYHILNHANLFGDSYTVQAETMTKSLIIALNQ